MTETLWVTSIFGAVGIFITCYYSHNSKKIADEKMLKELFTEFNQRYNGLNKYLVEIEGKYNSIDLFNEAENFYIIKQKVIDYFNLCAEEYFWHKHKERIDPVIWESWQIGMNYWIKVPTIKSLWKEEIKNNGYVSYYLNDEDEFFNI